MKRSQSGVTLVELMIALTVGLIVIGATIALVVSLMRSNNESIRAMRLSQEMRALADVASMEIRRARSLKDPLANVGQGAAAFVTCNAITPDAGGECLLFAYDCNPANNNGEFRALRKSGTNLVLSTGTGTLTCNAPLPVQLNSNELRLGTVRFATTAQGAVQMTLTGSLATDPGTSRTVTRVIWPRSAPVVP